MSPQIRRLVFVFALLFFALIGMSTYSLWRAPVLQARPASPTLIVRPLALKRGRIYASAGKTVLAGIRKRKVKDGRVWYLRRYPKGRLTAHAVGYSTIERSRTGLEQALNDFLTGSNANLNTLVDRALNAVRGLTQEG